MLLRCLEVKCDSSNGDLYFRGVVIDDDILCSLQIIRMERTEMCQYLGADPEGRWLGECAMPTDLEDDCDCFLDGRVIYILLA